MPKYRLNLISARRSYSIKEICSLFSVNRRTCGRWIKNDGLSVIEVNTSPLLVLGADLMDFIKEKRGKSRIPLKENEFYCLKCHKAVRAKIGSEQVVETGKTIGKDNCKQLKKIGICDDCGTKLNKLLGVLRRD